MKTDYPELYRRRYIPDELTHLDKDKILTYEPGKLMLTRWDTLNVKTAFERGVSAFLIDRGIKVSKLICADGSLYEWYIDIVEFDESPDKFLYTDLLIDVVIKPDGSVRVVDLDEAADAFEQALITKDQLLRAMRTTDLLLRDIRKGNLQTVMQMLEDAAK